MGKVRSKLSEEWLNAIHKHIHSYPQGKTEYLLETVKALHDEGVDILAGADSSTPDVGGMASVARADLLLVKGDPTANISDT